MYDQFDSIAREDLSPGAKTPTRVSVALWGPCFAFALSSALVTFTEGILVLHRAACTLWVAAMLTVFQAEYALGLDCNSQVYGRRSW